MAHFKLMAASLLVLLPMSQARAATSTSTMAVSATVQANCVVAASALAFGTYTGSAAMASTTVSVTCTSLTPYNVGLDAGTGSGASVASRLMSFGAATLSYGLFSNAGRSTVWGNTIGTNTVTATGTGLPQVLTVYGEIPANQYPAAGAYSDTVTVTVTD